MEKAGLYIHFPFCQKKCDYCDFYSITTLSRIPEFMEALRREIEITSALYSNLEFDSVFFGGGTPTILSAADLEQIWDLVHRKFKLNPGGEFSIEANPGTLEDGKLAVLRKTGFNRLSMGVQSFNREDLQFLGRIHTTEDVYRNFEGARKAGFANINIDLMTAFPGLTRQRFQQSLDEAVRLHPEHISCYTLIFERHTPFYARMKQGELKPVNEDREASFYRQAEKHLKKAGYESYEISNYASERKFRCLHNLKYWNHQPYLGLGPAAHSFIDNRRWWNARSIGDYAKSLSDHKLPIAHVETLEKKTLEFEYIFLHLRLKEGLDLTQFNQRFATDFVKKYEIALEQLKEEGLIRHKDNQINLTKKGWLLADEVAEFF